VDDGAEQFVEQKIARGLGRGLAAEDQVAGEAAGACPTMQFQCRSELFVFQWLSIPISSQEKRFDHWKWK
jgi:hypothetical protein